jgi:hypothetical protein
MNEYVTGTGQRLVKVHSESKDCHLRGCCIHAPSNHRMREWPTHWNMGRMERLCEHGIGHPDPDHVSYILRTFGKAVTELHAIHACDGCCPGLD